MSSGSGINLSNSNPTGCLNDAVRQHNQEHNTCLEELEREVFLARVFNALESLIHTFQTRGPGAVQHLYYRHWLHRYVKGLSGCMGVLIDCTYTC